QNPIRWPELAHHGCVRTLYTSTNCGAQSTFNYAPRSADASQRLYPYCKVCSYHVICDNLRSPFISPCDRCEKSSHSISRLGGDFCPPRLGFFYWLYVEFVEFLIFWVMIPTSPQFDPLAFLFNLLLYFLIVCHRPSVSS
ncbi:unnamed protein product, partial [Musa hybrid cultivar]